MITLKINDKTHTIDASPDMPLLWVLRDLLGMNGTKFAFVSAERANHAVSTLCRVIGVSVSGFYAWLQAIRTTPQRKPLRSSICDRIRSTSADCERTYRRNI